MGYYSHSRNGNRGGSHNKKKSKESKRIVPKILIDRKGLEEKPRKSLRT